jgi:4-alpha-glucanotransferase
MIAAHRSAGVLLHPTSLPGRWGIGEIGPEAVRWLDELHAAGQTLWQILPHGPTGYGNSPYQSLSSFAGNPLWISIDGLTMDGLLGPRELELRPAFPEDKVNFDAVSEVKSALLFQACENFRHQMDQSPGIRAAFEGFCQDESAWLDDYALFLALKQEQGGRAWTEWPSLLRDRVPHAMAEAFAALEEEIENAKMIQFFFFRQWTKLRKHAESLGIQIIGDIPIFVAHDSADVWSHRDLFYLDETGNPTVVAGVPPDYFSATGQRWGNPLYRWDRHRETKWAWWIERMGKILSLFDIVRIDHFRGFAQYWEIPAEEETAVNGRWVDSPGKELFDAMARAFPFLPVIAEDLGIITPDVEALRDGLGFPGMRVLHFAFGVDTLAEQYLPENYPENSVAYTGTHDNDTTLGLFRSEAGEGTTRTPEQVEAERRTILGYTKTDGSELNWDFIRLICASQSLLAIYPLQDILGLDSEARMNQPGLMNQKNWTWRFRWDQWTNHRKQKLLDIARETHRSVT